MADLIERLEAAPMTYMYGKEAAEAIEQHRIRELTLKAIDNEAQVKHLMGDDE